MKTPMTITLDATTWYAIESALKFASKQDAALGQDRDFVRGLLSSLSAAITETETAKTKPMLDCKPPVITLLHQLQKQGFSLVAVDDGVHRHAIDTNASAARQRAAAADAITAVDACRLIVRRPDATGTGWLYLVLGNGADEIPADRSVRPLLATSLDAAVNACQAIWEGKAVPTKPEEN